MNRASLLKFAAALPVIGALVSSPVGREAPQIAGDVEQLGATSYQFGRIWDGGWDAAPVVAGRPTVEQIGYAVRDGFNIVWQYVMRTDPNGNLVRYVHSFDIGARR